MHGYRLELLAKLPLPYPSHVVWMYVDRYYLQMTSVAHKCCTVPIRRRICKCLIVEPTFAPVCPTKGEPPGLDSHVPARAALVMLWAGSHQSRPAACCMRQALKGYNGVHI